MYLYFKIFNEPTILFLDVCYKKWYFLNSLPIRELDSESSYLNGHVGRSKFTKFSWALSLNTQSCIKGFLAVRHFCFWAIWAAGPGHKKSWGPIMTNVESVFLTFSGSNFFYKFVWKHYSVLTKLHNKLDFFIFQIL